MSSASREILSHLVEIYNALASFGGFLAIIGAILSVIFREWIKDWFARVAHERKFAGDKAIESHRADETLRVGIINELFRRKLGAHDAIRKAAVELSDCILELFAIVREQENQKVQSQNSPSDAWRRSICHVVSGIETLLISTVRPPPLPRGLPAPGLAPPLSIRRESLLSQVDVQQVARKLADPR
jgi:hypothetical protein